MSVTVDDVLHNLVARGGTPSNMGAQLARMRDGITAEPDPFRARDDAESGLIQAATLLRCISEFGNREEFSVATRQRVATAAGYKVLEKFRHVSKRGQGEIALGILRSYMEWSTKSQERGLYAVYGYLAGIAPSITPPPPKDCTDVLHAFRTGEAKKARNLAAEAVGDSMLALQTHVRLWNKRT